MIGYGERYVGWQEKALMIRYSGWVNKQMRSNEGMEGIAAFRNGTIVNNNDNNKISEEGKLITGGESDAVMTCTYTYT